MGNNDKENLLGTLLKSRVPGLISTINNPTRKKNDENKGNWNEIPYDLKLNEIRNLDALKLFDKKERTLWAIKVKCTTIDNKRTTETDIQWYRRKIVRI